MKTATLEDKADDEDDEDGDQATNEKKEENKKADASTPAIDIAPKVSASPAAHKMSHLPMKTIQDFSEASPSSGGNDYHGQATNVIAVSPDESSLPDPILKPDKF
jgi:hypothetical protein